MLNFKTFTILAIFLCTLTLRSQVEDLPKYMTAEEALIMPDYLDSIAQVRSSATLPDKPVRVMAEWEEIQALFITWRSYPGVLTEIVRHAVEEVKVYIITGNQGQVENILNNAGISLDSVVFVNWPTNTVWIRDYGPWAVYENDVEQLAISDYIYNRPRPLDNDIPERVAELFSLPHFAATQAPYNLVHTGGNNLVDGFTTGYSSKLILRENPGKTGQEIDYITNKLFGYDNYIKFDELPYDGISHIDMHMRFIDEETLIMGEYPEGVSDGPQIEKNIEYLLNHHSTAFGNPYEIKRIPMPPGPNGNYPSDGAPYRTFTNSIFLNKTILIPIYEEQYDTVGLRIHRENLPGYKVVGIDANAMINSLGALHCITKTVGVNDPLWIAHPRQRDIYDETLTPLVKALIKHRSGIEKVELFYKSEHEDTYHMVPMQPDLTAQDWYQAELPAYSGGTKVHYYIEAQATSGKVQRRPIVAPEGYFEYEVITPDTAPLAALSSDKVQICAGTQIRFLDRSENGVQDRLWLFEGGVPATSSAINPVVYYSNPGNYQVTLIVSNSKGIDTLVMEEYVHVESGIPPFIEDFNLGIQEVWQNKDSSNDTFTWTPFEGGDCYDNKSIVLDNFTSDNRGVTTTLAATFDLSEMAEPALFFSLAYAPYSAQYSETLQIEIAPCGDQPVVVYSMGGIDLATTPADTSAFIPLSCDQWRNSMVDISDFAGQSVTLNINTIGGWGNMMYLDNIFIKDMSLDNKPPVVTFVEPSSDTLIVAETPVQFTLDIEANDEDGFVESLILSQDGITVASFDKLPYQFAFNALEPGSYEFRALATDNEGLESEIGTIRITVDDVQTSTSSLNMERSFSISPNPANEQVKIQGKFPVIKASSTITLYDSFGRRVMGPILSHTPELLININHLAAGVYHVIWQQDEVKSVERLIKY